MQTFLDCYPCIVRQALEAARMATNDEEIHKKVLTNVMTDLSSLPMYITPPEIGQKMHKRIRELTNNGDPYHGVKDEYNKIALDLVPEMLNIIKSSTNKLKTAVQLAIAGNIIDFGALGADFDVYETIQNAVTTQFGVDHFEQFTHDLKNARMLLYLGDNAGEIVFDKLLVQQILNEYDVKIVFVVRGGPVLNDATIEDARAIGMDKIVTVIENGDDTPATVIHRSSDELKELYKNADMIIAKGQGNYETLSDESANIYFLLKVKCPVVARDLAVETGSLVIANTNHSERVTDA